MNYKLLKYDETIMQSRTVSNIIEALQQTIGNPDALEDAAYFLITTRNAALKLGDGRKANKKKEKK